MSINKKQAIKLLKENLKDNEMIFEFDDGWNALEWHRGKIENNRIISLENYTWAGQGKARTRWSNAGYDLKEVRLLKE